MLERGAKKYLKNKAMLKKKTTLMKNEKKGDGSSPSCHHMGYILLLLRLVRTQPCHPLYKVFFFSFTFYTMWDFYIILHKL